MRHLRRRSDLPLVRSQASGAYAPRNWSKGFKAVDEAVSACSFLNIHAMGTRELRLINCSKDSSIPAEKAVTTDKANKRLNHELFHKSQKLESERNFSQWSLFLLSIKRRYTVRADDLLDLRTSKRRHSIPKGEEKGRFGGKEGKRKRR